MEQKLNESYCFYFIDLYPRLNILVDKKRGKGKHPNQASFIYFPFAHGKNRVDGCIEKLA